jgi:phosphoheptose isomerase
MMAEATEKQIMRLKRFVKDSPELSKGLLKGVQFDQLSKEEASELIKKCYEKAGSGSGDGVLSGQAGDFVIRFSQNYRNGDGSFKTVALTDEELAEVRQAHSNHCDQIYQECVDAYPDDQDVQLAMFDKRADKVFSWIQQALDEKVRKTRGGNGGSKY